MNELLDQVFEYGAASLSDSQLFSLFIGQSAAQSLFTNYDNIAEIARVEAKQIAYQTLLNKEEATKTEAIFELSNRIQRASLGERIQITSPQDAVAYFSPKVRHMNKEIFIVGFLNNAKFLMGFKKISEGGATATIVDPAEVMRQAVINQANSILLLHNHPSGNRKESRADIQLTKRIAEGGKLLGVPVDDHIIIAGEGYTSFKAKGLL